MTLVFRRAVAQSRGDPVQFCSPAHNENDFRRAISPSIAVTTVGASSEPAMCSPELDHVEMAP
jgi:hypothetical protein